MNPFALSGGRYWPGAQDLLPHMLRMTRFALDVCGYAFFCQFDLVCFAERETKMQKAKNWLADPGERAREYHESLITSQVAVSLSLT